MKRANKKKAKCNTEHLNRVRGVGTVKHWEKGTKSVAQNKCWEKEKDVKGPCAIPMKYHGGKGEEKSNKLHKGWEKNLTDAAGWVENNPWLNKILSK